MAKTFVGLDIETTGSGYEHQLIQIGVALENGSTFESLIGHPADRIVWDEEAAAIHNIPREVVESADPVAAVDLRLFRWLDDNGVSGAHPVGWNVAGFDMTRVQLAGFPLTMSRMSYRTVDLNAIVFHLEAVFGTKYEKLKKNAKNFALKKLPEGEWHNARYDAQASLYAWEYLRQYTIVKQFAESSGV